MLETRKLSVDVSTNTPLSFFRLPAYHPIPFALPQISYCQFTNRHENTSSEDHSNCELELKTLKGPGSRNRFGSQLTININKYILFIHSIFNIGRLTTSHCNLKEGNLSIEALTKGKNLKPFICLLKLKMRGLVNQHNDEKLVRGLKGAFPYYSEDSLKEIVKLFNDHLSGFSDKSAEIRKWSNYLTYHKYRKEADRIQSPDLFHFVKKEYLLNILKKKFLYPSLVGLDEYKSLMRDYKGPLSESKESVIADKQLLKSWSKSIAKIQVAISKQRSAGDLNKILENSFLPAINCFTELADDNISLHSDHYGSYGLRFRKDTIVLKEYLFDEKINNLRHIRPVYYCDNSTCSLPWLILEKIKNTTNLLESDKKKLVEDLMLLKPVDQSLLSPKNIYSVTYEKEWRYVSFESVFKFKKDDIMRVLISKADYQNLIEGKDDPILVEILEEIKKRKYLMQLV